jgi:hypothetical protein
MDDVESMFSDELREKKQKIVDDMLRMKDSEVKHRIA